VNGIHASADPPVRRAGAHVSRVRIVDPLLAIAASIAQQQLEVRTPPSLWLVLPSPRLFGFALDDWAGIAALARDAELDSE
jgi:hypothetical protein